MDRLGDSDMPKRSRSAVWSRGFYLLFATVVSDLYVVPRVSAQDTERVVPITAPAAALPDENASSGVTKYSFIAYGDTRGDGMALRCGTSTR